MPPMLAVFLARIEAFLTAHPEVSPSALGVNAMGDAGFVFDLRREKPRSPRLSSVERVLAWMASYEVTAAATP